MTRDPQTQVSRLRWGDKSGEVSAYPLSVAKFASQSLLPMCQGLAKRTRLTMVEAKFRLNGSLGSWKDNNMRLTNVRTRARAGPEPE
jgi:hypothetical protein